VAALEKEMIIDALKNTRGNITLAAEILKTTVRKFAYKAKKYGVDYAVTGKADQFLFHLQGRQLGPERFLFIIFVVTPISPAACQGEYEQKGNDDAGGTAGGVVERAGGRVWSGCHASFRR
jgi:hypothetical protein